MPEVLANKIAAGEVVQRPASVVKELVENSIDAGASRIDIAIGAAGSELIQVTDNGCGMNRADAVACFERHATSKITTIEDLNCIRTLGFRGEALASIAAVSRLQLKTGQRSARSGTLVQYEGGNQTAVEPCAFEQGTSISIRTLFYNVPARRNFLKSPATEYRHIVDTFLSLAISNPEVGFSLTHNDASIYRLSPSGKVSREEALRARLIEIYGSEFDDDLVRVDEQTAYLSISGFIAVPERHKRSRGDQYLYVNDRLVKSRYIEHAIRSAYDDFLPEGAYPIFAIFLKMDPAHVDVNVHPTKAEVKFDDERGIYAMVKAVTARALASAFSVPQFDIPKAHNDAAGFPTPVDMGQHDRPSAGASHYRPADYRPGAVERALLNDKMYGGLEREDSSSEFLRNVTTLDRTESKGDLLYQLAAKYIVVQMRSGLILIDQQKAHERIIFEHALANLNGSVALSQQLLFPVTVEMAPGKFERVVELLDDLKLLGFDIEKFGGTSFVVRGVPSDVREAEINDILAEVASDRASSRAGKNTHREQLALSLARRTSVRSGARLSEHEMKVLVDQLFVCETPYVSPDGKPVVVWISTDEIERRFATMARPS